MYKWRGFSRNTIAVFLVALGTLLNGCAAQRGDWEADGEAASAHMETPSYLIGPGDVLNVFVWGNPDLTTTVPVRPDGRITTPLIEDVQASGKTPTQLAREMEARLARYIKNPQVTVTVTQFVGRYSEQIRVVGQAAQPKTIPYRENMTLLDVVIAVGGLTDFAAGNRAVIVRAGRTDRTQLRVRLNDLIKEGDIKANVKMMPGDILIIPEAWF